MPTGSGLRRKDEGMGKEGRGWKRKEEEVRRPRFGRNFSPFWAFGTFPANDPISATLFLPATREEELGGVNGDSHATTDMGRPSRLTGAWQDLRAPGESSTC